MLDKKKENARNGGHPSLVRSGMPKQRNALRSGENPGRIPQRTIPQRTSAFAPGGTSVRRREDIPAPRPTPAANQTQVEQKFGDAFRAARKSGVKAFNWQGKSYSTELARPPATRAGNSPRPASSSRELTSGANRAGSPRRKK